MVDGKSFRVVLEVGGGGRGSVLRMSETEIKEMVKLGRGNK